MRWIALPAAAALPLLVAACDARDALNTRRDVTRNGNVTAQAVAPVRPVGNRRHAAPAGGALDEEAAFGEIRSWLRRLVVAEETYFAENGTYTAVLDTVRFRPPSDVATTILWATRDGWAARASHGGIPSKDCVVYVGSRRRAPATSQLRRQAGEGVPVCDAPRGAGRPARPAPSAPRSVARASVVPDSGSGLDAVSPIVQMKVDLRNLARSQESWFGTQGAYSWRMEPFAMQYLWHRGVKISILSADRISWSAKATHDALPGKSCIIWYGPVDTPPQTDGQEREAARAAVPVCDDPS